ncbi:MAG: UDP-N-acetylmuramoylalanyl-D-glutamyl-2, 6-diaminopimelate--D-alanyl-D-alanine ligase, partial [Myxococcales bacterium]|nr:UDP-N-acetylmuramoylalanyl-D-glutamyl-2, 6-diaminopimelate--D-alanyl-D-alanine ligase [Myxococcales bacterium]
MRELGAESNALHRAVGRAAAKLPLAALFVVGDAAAPIAEGARAGNASFEVVDVPDADEAAERLRRWPGGGWMLVKASRGVALERVIDALAAATATANAGAKASDASEQA